MKSHLRWYCCDRKSRAVCALKSYARKARIRTVAASNNRDHARNLSLRMLVVTFSRSHVNIARATTSQSLLLLLARATYIMVLFFTHMPFVVNHTINATPPERLQQYHHECLVGFAIVSRSRCLETADRENTLFHFFVYSKSWTHTDIHNIGYKTHRGSALTNCYRRSAMTLNCGYFRLTASQLLLTCAKILGASSAATGFWAKITRFTKKFTRSEKTSLDLKILRRILQFCLKFYK